METIHLSHPCEIESTTKCSCVMALGFFDGIHVAHQSIINRAARIARAEKLALTVMTFYPHPRQIVGHMSEPMKYLTPLRIKKQIFSRLGVDRLYIVRFDEKIAKLSSSDFVQEYLISLRVKHVVVGFDFKYGNRGEGSIETLRNEGAGYFKVHEEEKLSHQYKKISSTHIRHLVSDGLVDLVPKYLGKHYEIKGTKISTGVFIISEPFLLPKSGIYLTKIDSIDQSSYGICRVDETVRIVTMEHHDFADENDEVNFHWLKRIESKPSDLGTQSRSKTLF